MANIGPPNLSLIPHANVAQVHEQPPPQRKASFTNECIAPAIFTPICGDELLAPFTPPTSRIERLHAKLEKLDANKKQVRTNLLALYRRQCLNLIRHQQAIEKDYQGMSEEHQAIKDKNSAIYSKGQVATEEALEAMVENVLATFDSNREIPEHESLNVQPDAEQPEVKAGVNSDREELTRRIEACLSQWLTDLKCHETSVARTRERYKELLDREMEKDSMEF